MNHMHYEFDPIRFEYNPDIHKYDVELCRPEARMYNYHLRRLIKDIRWHPGFPEELRLNVETSLKGDHACVRGIRDFLFGVRQHMLMHRFSFKNQNTTLFKEWLEHLDQIKKQHKSVYQKCYGRK
jgi:hypothetical protein